MNETLRMKRSTSQKHFVSQKVLQISAEDAKYIDPNQIASLTLTDGTQIIVKEAAEAQEFVEEANQQEGQYTTEQTEQKQQPLRGLGTNLALGAAALGAAALGAAAIGSAMKPRPMVGGMMGPRPMMGPPMMGPPMMRPPMRPPMMGPPMRGPMGRRF